MKKRKGPTVSWSRQRTCRTARFPKANREARVASHQLVKSLPPMTEPRSLSQTQGTSGRTTEVIHGNSVAGSTVTWSRTQRKTADHATVTWSHKPICIIPISFLPVVAHPDSVDNLRIGQGRRNGSGNRQSSQPNRRSGIQDEDGASRTNQPQNRTGKGQGDVIRPRRLPDHRTESKTARWASNSVFSQLSPQLTASQID